MKNINIMRKHFNLYFGVLLFGCCNVFFTACKSDDSVPASEKYDASKPITVTNLMPDSGGIRTQFIIEGSNFGSDVSKIHVTFNGDRKAVIVGSNGTSIYGLVPKEPRGNNLVNVSVDKSDTIKAGTFAYTPKELVSTVAGKGGTVGAIDGTLANARFNCIGGIGILADNLLLVTESHSTNIRLISVDENAVTTLSTGIKGSEPSVLDDKSAAYVVDRSAVGKMPIYILRKSDLWTPKKVANNVTFVGGETLKGEIWTTCLDDTQKYLYFMSSVGEFGRVSLDNPTRGQMLNNTLIPGGGKWVSLRYNKVDGNFYVSVQNRNQIYQIHPPVNRDSSSQSDWMGVIAYAGTSFSGGQDGPKDNATFYNIGGLDIDSRGDLYIVDSYSMIVRKLELSSGIVSTIAGIYKPNSGADIDGEPLESQFNWPYIISHDSEDNFFIGERWGACIRKLAIE